MGAALRAGGRPQQINGIDGCTWRAKQLDTIAQGPDGDVLILVRHGRVTMLGRARGQRPSETTRFHFHFINPQPPLPNALVTAAHFVPHRGPRAA